MSLGFFSSVQVLAFVAAFVIGLVAGPVLIPFLKRLKFGQTVRDDGPSTHFRKTGTPTIGGLIFIIPIILLSVLYLADYPQILPMLLAVTGFGAIGFVDDFIKVVRKHKDGLNAKQKTAGQLLVAVAFACYMAFTPGLGTDIIIPFMDGGQTIYVPEWIYIPVVVIFIMYFFTNSVNLTDGVDGLAAGVTLVVTVFFIFVAMTSSEWAYVKIFCSIAAGGCLAFLVFNMHPAKVFMGDTGSLALGGVVTTAAIVMKIPWILIIAGGIYLAEGLSVILQVASFKLTGRRIFRMAPLHHHFELSGWRETKVVWVFWSVTVLLCVLAYYILGLG